MRSSGGDVTRNRLLVCAESPLQFLFQRETIDFRRVSLARNSHNLQQKTDQENGTKNTSTSHKKPHLYFAQNTKKSAQ